MRRGNRAAAWTLCLTLGLLSLLVMCGDQTDAPRDSDRERSSGRAAPGYGAPGYGGRTDSRGWAVSDEGLFGHRRVPASTSTSMKGLGYAQGSEAAPPQTGVLIHVDGRVSPGLNLMNSGDAAEAVLMSSKGSIEHRWALPYEQIPDAPPLDTAFQIPWRRIHLLDDGSLLAIHSDAALVYLDG